MPVNTKLIQLIQATAELYGRNMSPLAAEIMLEDLRHYEEIQIYKAMTKCRKELRTFPTVADILARLDDGHPGVEEAWSLIPKDEDGSVIWTDEMSGAFGIARPLLTDGDLVAARMAFKEAYLRLVTDARNSRRVPNWSASFGFSRAGRQVAIEEALSKNRISSALAQILLPEQPTPSQISKITKLVFQDMPR